MARTRRRPRPTRAQTLTPVLTHCPECGHKLWADYANYRTVAVSAKLANTGRGGS